MKWPSRPAVNVLNGLWKSGHTRRCLFFCHRSENLNFLIWRDATTRPISFRQAKQDPFDRNLGSIAMATASLPNCLIQEIKGKKQLVCRPSCRLAKLLLHFYAAIFYFPFLSCFVSSILCLSLFLPKDQNPLVRKKGTVCSWSRIITALLSASAWQNGFVFSICSTFKRCIFVLFFCATRIVIFLRSISCCCADVVSLSWACILTRDFNLLDNVIRQQRDGIQPKNKMDYIVV